MYCSGGYGPNNFISLQPVHRKVQSSYLRERKEQHVSHMLAGRLSSRPMKWSKETLKRFAPILVSDGSINFENSLNDVNQGTLHLKAVRAARTAFRCGKTVGLPLPDSVGTLPVLNAGITTSLYKALKGLS
jgi:hypothetical protein